MISKNSCKREGLFRILGCSRHNPLLKSRGFLSSALTLKKRIVLFSMFALVIAIFGQAVLAQQGVNVPTVCCEETEQDLFCQNVPIEECKSEAQTAPTACESTSFCKGGYCYDSVEGTCLPNTPKKICDENEGTWSAVFPKQCNLGCCVLGDQAAFVSLPRCKRLSSLLGLAVRYDSLETNEATCILSAQADVNGACVYDLDFERACRMTTRWECANGVGEGGVKGDFYAGKLCTAEVLGTSCAITSQTMCDEGRDEVYFRDSCGNKANIFDKDMINDKDYWTNIIPKSESCGSDEANINNDDCGNCNYLLGSICRTDGGNPSCVELNCRGAKLGTDAKHGESWCAIDGTEENVGGRHFRHICVNGEVITEACADFKQEICIEGSITLFNNEEFVQSACRVNRWQDCFGQNKSDDCLNSDIRDCQWSGGFCLPINAPGLQFWKGTDAEVVCGALSGTKTFTEKYAVYEGKGDAETAAKDKADVWIAERKEACSFVGDCGIKTNWVGEESGGIEKSIA